MKDIDKAQIQEILESRDEKLVEELITLIKESSMAIKTTKKENTFGDRVSDKIAAFAGSWTFIITFVLVIIGWIGFNVFSSKPVDPFPFILLNLLLSLVAAIQAPLIMMSQNREEQRNQEKATSDFFVNVKSELLIEDIHSTIKDLEQEIQQLKNERNQ